ncbi:MAG: hypothetical protein ACODAD_10570, partial [Planctomycetota bacterium]
GVVCRLQERAGPGQVCEVYAAKVYGPDPDPWFWIHGFTVARSELPRVIGVLESLTRAGISGPCVRFTGSACRGHEGQNGCLVPACVGGQFGGGAPFQRAVEATEAANRFVSPGGSCPSCIKVDAGLGRGNRLSYWCGVAGGNRPTGAWSKHAEFTFIREIN